MKDYVKEFQKKIAAIDKDSQGIRIINAGVMNHGKSSLFNSLLDKDVFAEQDIRTTMTAAEALWEKDVYLVDTPGLNAEQSDDAEAYAAYRRANMIVFCHTAKVGELRAAELNAINGMKKLFDSDEFFWQHFCLVITFLDSDSVESIEVIKNKSLSDIKNTCGGQDFPVFLISNTRYRKGRDENKEKLVQLSGVSELRNYLSSQFTRFRSENTALRFKRINREKEDLLELLRKERDKVERTMQRKEASMRNRQEALCARVEYVVSEAKSDKEVLAGKRSVLSSLKADLARLRTKHDNERY